MASDGEHVDTLIKGARVIDGTGAPAVQGDVAVKYGRIVAIGDLTGWTAENVPAVRAAADRSRSERRNMAFLIDFLVRFIGRSWCGLY